MGRLYKNKAIALFETHLSRKYVAMTVCFYVVAAVIWFALCVLAPYLGYVTVTAEENSRLTREAFSATKAEKAVPDSLKERAFIMPSGEESFYRRIRLVEDANSKIDFLVFDSNNDSGSRYFYTAILRAADRGVKARIILDGKIGKLDGDLKPIGDLLQNHKNIEFYYFNELNLIDVCGLTVLCHDKVLIVDDDRLIVGGANMGLYAYTKNYDAEVMVTNSSKSGAVGSAREHYEHMLNSGLVKRKKSKTVDFSIKETLENELSEYLSDFEFDGTIDYATQGVPVDKITYLANPVSDEKKPPIIYTAIMNLARTSKQSAFVSPYFLLVDDKIKELRNAAADSDSFTIITNSLYNTRNSAFSVYNNNRDKYIDESIDLYEFQMTDQLHAKTYLFDGRYSVIGSFNMDERSIHIDTESVLIIDSETFAAQVEEYVMRPFIENSLKVGADNEYIPSDTVTAGEVPASKRVKYFFTGAMELIINML